MSVAAPPGDEASRRPAKTPQPPEPPKPQTPAAKEPASTGWLQTLRTKLGLEAGPTLRDTLEDALSEEAKTASAFTVQERDMLLRILRFGALRVGDIKVPRVDIVAIEENEPLAALARLFTEAEVSRIPVYRETLDDPRGMIHIKDLVSFIVRRADERAGVATGEKDPKEPKDKIHGRTPAIDVPLALAGVDLDRTIVDARLNRPVLFVPPSMPAVNLLLRMQSTRIHLAIIVDEHGGTEGLVSIEDLVEQIVGEIEDEHDEDDQHVSVDANQDLIAVARTPVAELEQLLGTKLQLEGATEEVATLGGLVFAVAGRVPTRGELVRHPAGIEIEIIDADPRRLKKLKIHRRKEAAPASPAPAAPPSPAPRP
jgi:CBS domain containing-hemolysin-like protein